MYIIPNIYTVQEAIRANIFSRIGTAQVYTDFIWAEDMATQGCDQSADSAVGMKGVAQAAPPITFWRESGKSQGFGECVRED
jgi:hypothetical protein